MIFSFTFSYHENKQLLKTKAFGPFPQARELLAGSFVCQRVSQSQNAVWDFVSALARRQSILANVKVGYTNTPLELKQPRENNKNSH